MSLIQEALRRQREESTGSPAPSGDSKPDTGSAPAAPVPSVPPPLPVHRVSPAMASAPEAAPPATGEEPKRRTVLLIVGVVLLILVLAAGGIGLVTFAFKQWNASKASQRLAAPSATESNPAATAPLNATTPEAPHAPASTPPTAMAGSQPAPEPPLPVAPTALPVAATATLAPEHALVAWPFLKVGGVVGKGLRGAATINGRIVAVGEEIDGVEVVSIGDYGAKLEFQNEMRFVKVGNTVE